MTNNPTNPENEKLVNEDYLWDASGAPDPEIQRLESLLVNFRHADRPLVLPAELPVAPGKFRALLIPMLSLPRLAAAAAILLAAGLGLFFFLRPHSTPEAGPAWDVASLQGAPQIGTKAVAANQPAAKLHVGQTIVTNNDSRASLSQEDLGEIRIDPNSRVRLVQTDANRKRIQLDVGTIHAAIWAPPGTFVVDTPSAVAIDLGCSYTLHVSPDGSGELHTTYGWVGFHLHGRDSFIPAGAMCSTRPQHGPGIPYFEDATPAFREAVAQFDSSAENSADRAAALAKILSEARVRDALSLWHLLFRVNGAERSQVYARFAVLVPPPNGVTRPGILNLDQSMLDLWWNSLGLGEISTWRFWQQSAYPQPPPNTQPLLQKKQPPAK
ncbi:MAG TPA: FecR family protein [Candidatus Acidoferrum sp.]|nr:FecR family protein [Candidatus Acidoferrum sp.]